MNIMSLGATLFDILFHFVPWTIPTWLPCVSVNWYDQRH